MKRTVLIMFLIILLSLLCACHKTENPDNLEFPKTTWDMNMEEVLDSYGITKKDTNFYRESSKAPSFMIEGYKVFGKEATQIVFNFIDLENNENEVLCMVKVIYPENTDMNHVLEEMKKTYLDTVSEISLYDLFQPLEDSITEIKYQDSENTKLWAGSPIAELIPEKESEAYRDLWIDFQPNLNADNWDMFSQNARTVAVVWSHEEDMNMLSFYAYNLAVYNHLNSQLSEQQ